jgi:hypothetical protein
MHNNNMQNKGGEKAGNEAGKMSLKHSGSKSQRSAPHEPNHEPIKHSAIPARAKSVNQTVHRPKEAFSNELLDNTHCFDSRTHMEMSRVLENSTTVLMTQTQKLYWSTSEINDCCNLAQMLIKTQDFRTLEVPAFITGSSHAFFTKNSSSCLLILVEKRKMADVIDVVL